MDVQRHEATLRAVQKPPAKPWRSATGAGAAPPPKVYRVEPREFRDLVQRLTGAPPTTVARHHQTTPGQGAAGARARHRRRRGPPAAAALCPVVALVPDDRDGRAPPRQRRRPHVGSSMAYRSKGRSVLSLLFSDVTVVIR
jgi:hypothetical protein